MDILQAHKMVCSRLETLKLFQQDFEAKVVRNNFVSWATHELEERNCDINIQNGFLIHRIRRKKIIFSEILDEPIVDPVERYKDELFTMVLNTVFQSISPRFSKHETLAADFNCLHPKNFLKSQKTPIVFH